MISGSKYRIVGWGLLRCSSLFWSLLGLLSPVSVLFMAVGESAPESVPGEVAKHDYFIGGGVFLRGAMRWTG
jgi:hypothetical protein